MSNNRIDETWHRLRDWTAGSAAAERLAAQILVADGFSDVDPSHPLGGPDGGRDLLCDRDGRRWAVGVWFPRGEKSFAQLKDKFSADLDSARKRNSDIEGFAFVTNQEIRLAERQQLGEMWPDAIRLLHLERLAVILDEPTMHSIREQYLGIQGGRPEGIGGEGGGGSIVGNRGTVIGGRGGRGGVSGRGGSGGGGEVFGDDGLVVGGDGGDAGGADGRGGRGAPSVMERDLPMLDQIPSAHWGAGRGGPGVNHPEYDRRVEVLRRTREEYRDVFPERWRYVEAGIERVPARWINKRLEELGESWRVTMGEEGYILPPLDAT